MQVRWIMGNQNWQYDNQEEMWALRVGVQSKLYVFVGTTAAH